jgi:hypothetical protein
LHGCFFVIEVLVQIVKALPDALQADEPRVHRVGSDEWDGGFGGWRADAGER